MPFRWFCRGFLTLTNLICMPIVCSCDDDDDILPVQTEYLGDVLRQNIYHQNDAIWGGEHIKKKALSTILIYFYFVYIFFCFLLFLVCHTVAVDWPSLRCQVNHQVSKPGAYGVSWNFSQRLPNCQSTLVGSPILSSRIFTCKRK